MRIQRRSKFSHKAGIRWCMVLARWERLPCPSPPWTSLWVNTWMNSTSQMTSVFQATTLTLNSIFLEALFISANDLFQGASLYLGWYTVFPKADVTRVENVLWQISSILSNSHVKSTCMYPRLYTAEQGDGVLAQARLNPPGARKEKQRFITVIKFQPSRDEVKWEQQSAGKQQRSILCTCKL